MGRIPITSNLPMGNELVDRSTFVRSLTDETDVINTITRFLENVQISNNDDTRGERDEPRPGTSAQNMDAAERENAPQQVVDDQSRGVAEKMILDAEHYQAGIQKPNGNVIQVPSCFPSQTIDDEFFHLTCHVDSSLIAKIERGEFVDLERLLSKDPVCKLGADNRMEIVNKDGYTYFVPAVDRETSRIGGIRKWEQAFRVYAAIYS